MNPPHIPADTHSLMVLFLPFPSLLPSLNQPNSKLNSPPPSWAHSRHPQLCPHPGAPRRHILPRRPSQLHPQRLPRRGLPRPILPKPARNRCGRKHPREIPNRRPKSRRRDPRPRMHIWLPIHNRQRIRSPILRPRRSIPLPLFLPTTPPPPFPPTLTPNLGVGVSAYLGAAASITSDPYLTAAGAILTIESRHSAYIRLALSQKPFPSPFDTPLSPNEVHTLAHAFILSCPPNTPPLPVKAFPALSLSTTPGGVITTGTTITITTPGYVLAPRGARARLYAAFVSITGPIFADLVIVEGGVQVQVPEGIAGQSYLLLVDCKERVSDDTIVAGPVIVEVSF